MSVDDNIEIAFPSLARVARSNTPRPVAPTAADAIDDPTPADSATDDFAWLTAIFADDETTIEELPKVEDLGDESSDSNGAGGPLDDRVEEAVIGPYEAPEGPPATEDTLVLPPGGPLDLATDPEPPGIDVSTARREGASETNRDFDPEAAQEPLTDDTDDPAWGDVSASGKARDLFPAGLAELKKTNGFREEILSTFSQMYRKSARPD